MTSTAFRIPGCSIALVALVLAAAGCDLSSDKKTSCMVQANCLDGYLCTEGFCVKPGSDGPDDDDDGSVFAPPDAGSGGNGSGGEYGSVAAFSPASWGLAVAENSAYQTAVTLTSASGGLGCALISSESADPGTQTHLTTAKLGSDGDSRCPDGVFPVSNDKSRCGRSDDQFVSDGCAAYKQWSPTGDQVSYRAATGGYISVSSAYVNQQSTRCDVDVSLSFSGGVSVKKQFSFTYNPLGPTEAFCGP